MLEIQNLKKDITFNNNIAEICSISLENDFNIENNTIKGEFLIEGTYRSHEISLNQENYSYKIPFNYELAANVDENSVKVNVQDFTYEINANELSIDVEYEISYEEKELDEFNDEEEFERFLSEHEVDVVDFKENTSVDDDSNDDTEEVIENKIEEEDIRMDTTNEKEMDEDIRDISGTLIENITNKEENFITYHIYICDNTDTIESVAKKFNISVDVLKNYNSIDNIDLGMKLIIPYVEE